jgi:class 3 adenylate cyclase
MVMRLLTRFRPSMSIRLKILAVTTLLLVVFAVTTAVSAVFIKRVIAELEGIADYHLRLSDIAAAIDVETFEYELNIRRLLQSDAVPADQLAASVRRQREIAERLDQSFDRALALLATAIRDERNDVSDRIELARIEGAFRALRRHVAPFTAVGGAVLKAIAEGRPTEAQRLAAGFAAFETAFGPDLAEIRRTIQTLTRDSARETSQQTVTVLAFNSVLFVMAAAVGLILFGMLTHRLARAFGRLLDGTRAVQRGQLAVELPITSDDEIGQLTRSFNHMVMELQAKERIKDTFGKYLDPRIVNDLLRSSSENPEAAERRTVTVFFSDIEAFSAMGEQLTAGALVNLLNRYFGVVTRAVLDRHGIVDKYVGDAVMAFWTPPFSPGDRHAADGCLAALAQQEAISAFRQDLPDVLGLRRNVPGFRVRMGLTTGEVVIGTIGSDQTKSYTIVGDTVNLASRLEGANKIYGTAILISDDTYRLAQQAIEVRELDLLTVAGKSEPIRVFELLARLGELSPEQEELRGLFAEGLAAYRDMDWDRAERGFRACLERKPDDGPAQAFERRIALLRSNPPPFDWDRVWRVAEK